jgi:hypothetical protein
MTPLENNRKPEPPFPVEVAEQEFFEHEEERRIVFEFLIDKVMTEISEKEEEGAQLEDEEFEHRLRLLFLPEMEERIILEQIRDLKLQIFERGLLDQLQQIIDEEDEIPARDLLVANLHLSWREAQNDLTRIYFTR